MKLFTKEILRKMPKLYDTDGKPKNEVKVQAKLFNPCGAATWYITEYSPEEKIAFGFSNLGDDQNAELGYISIEELENLRLPYGLKIERDRYFEATLEEVMTFKKR